MESNPRVGSNPEPAGKSVYQQVAGQFGRNVIFAGAAFGLAHLAFQWKTWLGWVIWGPLTLVAILDVLQTLMATGLGLVTLFAGHKLDPNRRADQRWVWGANFVRVVQSVILIAAAYFSGRGFVF